MPSNNETVQQNKAGSDLSSKEEIIRSAGIIVSNLLMYIFSFANNNSIISSDNHTKHLIIK